MWTAFAAWAQAFGVIGTLIITVRQGRRQVVERIMDEARLVSGWLYQVQPSRDKDNEANWVLEGKVHNRSNSTVWNVVAEVMGTDGQPLPLPPLSASAVDPGRTWHLRWGAGWKVQPWDGNPKSISPTTQLGLPKELTKPNARLYLRLTFDCGGSHRWQSQGSHLALWQSSSGTKRWTIKRRRTETTLKEIELPRGSGELKDVFQAIKRMEQAVRSGKQTQDVLKEARSVPGGVLGSLRQLVMDSVKQRMLQFQTEVRLDDVANKLTRDEWSFRDDFTHCEIIVLQGALYRFGREEKDGNLTELSDDDLMKKGDPEETYLSFRREYDQACSTLVALNGLKFPHRVDRNEMSLIRSFWSCFIKEVRE